MFCFLGDFFASCVIENTHSKSYAICFSPNDFFGGFVADHDRYWGALYVVSLILDSLGVGNKIVHWQP